jgi:hypothetical protein
MCTKKMVIGSLLIYIYIYYGEMKSWHAIKTNKNITEHVNNVQN